MNLEQLNLQYLQSIYAQQACSHITALMAVRRCVDVGYLPRRSSHVGVLWHCKKNIIAPG